MSSPFLLCLEGSTICLAARQVQAENLFKRRWVTTKDDMNTRTPLLAPWMRILVRIDFIVAVALTVLAPLALLTGAVREQRASELRVLLRYWRVSSLLMVTVYLLIGERRVAFPTGLAARLLIARTLLGTTGPVDEQDVWFAGWRRAAGSYCVAGAVLTTPLLRGSFSTELPPICRAYIEPTQEFAALLHPLVASERLGRIGVVGLWVFAAGALIESLATRRR